MKLTDILEELEVFELAYLIKNRINEFMPDTQNRLALELLKRGYEKSDIESILAEKRKEPKAVNSSFLICKNCGSTKFYTSEQSKQNDYFAEIDYNQVVKRTTYTCYICNTVGQIVDKKEPTFIDRLFGRFKTQNRRVK